MQPGPELCEREVYCVYVCLKLPCHLTLHTVCLYCNGDTSDYTRPFSGPHLSGDEPAVLHPCLLYFAVFCVRGYLLVCSLLIHSQLPCRVVTTPVVVVQFIYGIFICACV